MDIMTGTSATYMYIWMHALLEAIIKGVPVTCMYARVHVSTLHVAGSPTPEIAAASGGGGGVQVCGGRCGDPACSLSFSSSLTLTQHIQLGQLHCTTVSRHSCSAVLCHMCISARLCTYNAFHYTAHVLLLIFTCTCMYMYVYIHGIYMSLCVCVCHNGYVYTYV